jgi:soluble lytic murein transglycosylase-like protein
MRGIGYTLSRLPSARVLLAGATIIATTFMSPAHGQSFGSGNGIGTTGSGGLRGEEVASAVPRAAHDSETNSIFPRPLRPSDAAVTQRIFILQRHGDIAKAIRSTDDLEDPLLLGSILADRYLSRYHKSTTTELSDWMVRYHDLPDAVAVHELLVTKAPGGEMALPSPDVTSLNRSNERETLPEDVEPPLNDVEREPGLERAVLYRAERGDSGTALRLIGARRGLTASYAAQLRAEVAQVAFTRNADAEALRIVQASLKDVAAEHQAGLAFYVGGLAAWRLEQLDVAKAMFEAGAQAGVASPQVRAASAFWASRVCGRLHDGAGATRWLRAAAEQRVTLHGLLARRILRMDTGILPSGQLLSRADVDAVAATPQGWRAFALFQVGQPERAESELRALWGRASSNAVFGQSLLMVASAAGLTDFAAQMAGLLQSQDGLRHEELRFAMPRLRPAGGFRIDPSLVYALTRLESNFNPEAVSPVGARGLMQIMPATAQFVMGDVMLSPRRLHEPATNLEIGQRYVTHLASLDGIDNDLIRLLASYNSGPGNFAHWGAEIRDGGDPLLFIEAIPVAETRAFVPHVLLYSWIYASRLRIQAPSLDSLAAGQFPRFTPPEQKRTIELVASGLH